MLQYRYFILVRNRVLSRQIPTFAIVFQLIQFHLLVCAISFNISSHQYFSLFFRYFHDGLKTIEHFGTYIEDLVNKLTIIRQNQFEEKRDLEDVRNMLKTSPGFNKMVKNEI